MMPPSIKNKVLDKKFLIATVVVKLFGDEVVIKIFDETITFRPKVSSSGRDGGLHSNLTYPNLS